MTIGGGGHSLGIYFICLDLQPYRVCGIHYTHTTYRLCVIVSILPMRNLRFRDIVLESCGCCNKLPQPGWLKRAEAYSLTVLEALLLKSKYWQVCAHSSSSRGTSTFYLFHLLVAVSFLNLWLHHFSLYLCGHIASPILSVCVFSFACLFFSGLYRLIIF